ncbi:phosphotransferase [Actinocatenispora sera]|uniref:phosphotransferase family protein n=1 Tax=Actinocatenispora sera TaxID=390989 RepID=UPI0033E3D774
MTDVLSWAAEQLGCPVRRLRPLTGGTHARTELLATGDGREVVLRVFPAGDPAVQRETRVLPLLDGLAGLAPRLLAADPDGAATGRPTLLVSRLPGDGCLAPADPPSWARQLGRTLARIHAVPVGIELRDPLAAGPTGAGPTGPTVREHWHRLVAQPRVLTHLDYWSGNTLWVGDRLTGVVDWSGAAYAPRGFDVAWCRLDLILLYDSRIADVFTDAYRSAAGSLDDVELWDRSAAMHAYGQIETWAPNYAGLGRPDLDGPALRDRLTRWTDTLA